MAKGLIKKEEETNKIMEGEEIVSEYFKTNRLTFGVSELLPGGKKKQ